MTDYWKKKTDTHPGYINGDCVRKVSDFKFLSLHLDDDLESERHCTCKEGLAAPPLWEYLKRTSLLKNAAVLLLQLNEVNWGTAYLLGMPAVV